MCQFLLGVVGKVQLLFGAFCCALKEGLSFKCIWNKVCSAKPRMAQELALTSSKPPHSHGTNLLFLLFPGQIFRNSLFSLLRVSSPPLSSLS